MSGVDGRWQLLALDQRGHAYYADDLENIAAVAVYSEADWELFDEYINVSTEATVRDVCDRIADVHGLAGLPDDVIDRCTGSSGGEQA